MLAKRKPWKLKNTEPAFSCIEDVDDVATIFKKVGNGKDDKSSDAHKRQISSLK